MSITLHITDSRALTLDELINQVPFSQAAKEVKQMRQRLAAADAAFARAFESYRHANEALVSWLGPNWKLSCPTPAPEQAAPPKPKEGWEHRAVEAVLDDLCDRRSIKRELRQIDDDVMQELKQTMARLIRKAHAEG